MLDLDPNNKTVVLKVEYALNDISVVTLKDAFEKYYERFKNNKNSKLTKKECYDKFMHSKSRQFFKIVYKAILFDKIAGKICPDKFRVIDKRKVELTKIISIKYIANLKEKQ